MKEEDIDRQLSIFSEQQSEQRLPFAVSVFVYGFFFSSSSSSFSLLPVSGDFDARGEFVRPSSSDVFSLPPSSPPPPINYLTPHEAGAAAAKAGPPPSPLLPFQKGFLGAGRRRRRRRREKRDADILQREKFAYTKFASLYH